NLLRLAAVSLNIYGFLFTVNLLRLATMSLNIYGFLFTVNLLSCRWNVYSTNQIVGAADSLLALTGLPSVEMQILGTRASSTPVNESSMRRIKCPIQFITCSYCMILFECSVYWLTLSLQEQDFLEKSSVFSEVHHFPPY
ncbi:hypothetical protein L9F63_024783, partial [Diploptera punctata]